MIRGTARLSISNVSQFVMSSMKLDVTPEESWVLNPLYPILIWRLSKTVSPKSGTGVKGHGGRRALHAPRISLSIHRTSLPP